MHIDRTQGPKKNSIERTLHLRVRDKHAGFLLEQSRWVNFLWNYDNELSWKVLDREGRFLSGYDLHEFTRGATKEGLPLHSQTVQAVNEEYARRRLQSSSAPARATACARSTPRSKTAGRTSCTSFPQASCASTAPSSSVT